MAQAGRTFRIFISSTFSDLKEERNALQQYVFPRLRDLCHQHGCRFQAIDLRWGVSDEAGLDQQTMKICLDEVARSQRTSPRPNFIVLLGDRYGWQPLPADIVAQEFEAIQQRILDADDRALLEHWYKRDDNAVPPVYCLQPRTGAFTDFTTWELVERQLRSILLQATALMNLTAAERLKYTASATEQEIAQGALGVPDAQEHVFCFFRTIRTSKNLPLTEDVPPDRSAQDFVDLLEAHGAYQLDTEAHACLERLKHELRNRLVGNIYDEYEVQWTGSGITTHHLDKLCEDVFSALARVIVAEIRQLNVVDPQEREIEDHYAFGVERTQFFTGRVAILQSIRDYVAGRERHPLVVFGASGAGKSALIARAAEQARSGHTNAEVVVRFVGTTSDSSDGRALLESLCRQISRRYGADESTVPADYRELVQEVPRRLALATAERPLLVFLDALDQLSDVEHSRNLVWLPAELPEHVRLIVSTLPGECLAALERKRPAARLLELEPMLPEEGRTLLDLWLKDAGRTLQAHQRQEVLSKFERNGLPLYLKLAFEEVRHWTSSHTPPEMGGTVDALVEGMLARLEEERHHGRELTSRALANLAAARRGLTEEELLGVLSADVTVMADFRRRSPRSPAVNELPVVVWSRLHAELVPYLTRRQAGTVEVMAFYHRQVAASVAVRYQAQEHNAHARLAAYFDTPSWTQRTLDELPWQWARAGEWKPLVEKLGDLAFFNGLWTLNRFDLKKYWTEIEAQSDSRMVDTYRRAIEMPSNDADLTWNLASLLHETAHLDEALRLREYQVEYYRRSSDVDKLAGALGNQAAILQQRWDLKGALGTKGAEGQNHAAPPTARRRSSGACWLPAARQPVPHRQSQPCAGWATRPGQRDRWARPPAPGRGGPLLVGRRGTGPG